MSHAFWEDDFWEGDFNIVAPRDLIKRVLAENRYILRDFENIPRKVLKAIRKKKRFLVDVLGSLLEERAYLHHYGYMHGRLTHDRYCFQLNELNSAILAISNLLVYDSYKKILEN